ncbi:MAG TPA: hypothetical protein DDZ74_16050 [Pseudomonas sp.]|nr:hypothetical protein [Pseudomonas sp.]
MSKKQARDEFAESCGGGQGGRLSASEKSSAARAAHRAVPNPRCVCRSGFTREYGGGGNGDRQVEIG